MQSAPDWNPTFTKLQPPTIQNLRIRSVHDAHKLFHAVYLERFPMVVRRLDAEERKLIKSGDVHVWEERGPSTEGLGLGIERWTDGKLWGPSRVRDNFLFYHEKDREPADFHGGSKWAKMLSGGVVVFRRRSRGDANSNAYTGPLSQTLDANGNPMGMEMGVMNPHERATSSGFEDHLSLPVANYSITRDRLVKQTYSVIVKLPKDRGGTESRKWHMTAYFAPNSTSGRPLQTIDDIPWLRELDVPKGMYQPARVGRGMGRHRSTAGLDPNGTGHRGVHIPTEVEDIDPDDDVHCALGDSDGSENDLSGKRIPNQANTTGKRLGIGGIPEDVPGSRMLTSKQLHQQQGPSQQQQQQLQQQQQQQQQLLPTQPPPLAIASMPVVPSQPPSLGLALHPHPPPTRDLGIGPSSRTQSIYSASPPPPSPSSRSIRSLATSSEPQLKDDSYGRSRRSCVPRGSSHRYSPYEPAIRLQQSDPSSPVPGVVASPRTSLDGWHSSPRERDTPATSVASPSMCTISKVHLPPLSCGPPVVGERPASSRYSARRRDTSESVSGPSSSLPSISRSRSSSLSEAASSITQSLQTPRTDTPPRQVLIGSGVLSSGGFSQIGAVGGSGGPKGMAAMLNGPLPPTREASLPPLMSASSLTPGGGHGAPTKSQSLVPLSFLENLRTTQGSTYSLPVPYGPGAVSARRAVDTEILRGLNF